MYRTICRQYLIENDFCLKFDFIQKTWNIMHILNGEIFIELIIRGNLFDFFSKTETQPAVCYINKMYRNWMINLVKGFTFVASMQKSFNWLNYCTQSTGSWKLIVISNESSMFSNPKRKRSECLLLQNDTIFMQ